MKTKIRKFIKPFLILISVSLFIVSTVVFFVNRSNTKYYSISYESYSNVSSVNGFQDGIKNQIGVDLDDMFIKNAGEIKTDVKGNIISLNIDCEFKQEDETYNVQIKNSDKSEYKLITSKSNGLSINKISLKDALCALTYYDFKNKNDDLDYKFMINNELTNNIVLNDNATKQYVVLENSINEVKSDLSGIFSRITILLNNSFEELYFQI